MTTLYGIKNCDSVKKAQKQFDNNQYSYQFHDFVKQGLSQQILNQWLQLTDWQTLLNKRSTNYRQLPDELKQDLNEEKVIQLLLENPKLVKRPVIVGDKGILVGYNQAQIDAWMAS
ncbi:Spx/MgsR family RNA polymerase-binding regulatory protein [Paraferrimonas haliotis]|uniref:Arsenate reductase n=1 Tax=Paraferrimonas haliotis TaxID=2013866 RepID=A0AA37TW84_9GAMM|nr:Spx/MgsR family RNA polymerase-binding regulatory protein [Paraferrimonas haliotis]GLS84294.1 arsenate reductase [Paraferrimonas haliotis]